jgi:ABC-type arginine transport system ATPase subunit
MTNLWLEAVQKISNLPEDRQDDAAHVLLSMVDDSDTTPLHLSKDQIIEVEKAIADMDRGECADETTMRQVLLTSWA